MRKTQTQKLWISRNTEFIWEKLVVCVEATLGDKRLNTILIKLEAAVSIDNNRKRRLIAKDVFRT